MKQEAVLLLRKRKDCRRRNQGSEQERQGAWARPEEVLRGTPEIPKPRNDENVRNV